MNVYDFDGTIYDGDSSRDFILFLYARHPLSALKRLPGVAKSALLCLTKQIRLADMKAHIFGILSDLPNPEGEVRRFWNSHERKIRPFYRTQREADDVICSASPEFLLKEIASRLGSIEVIATVMDPVTGVITGENCKGKEKVPRFRALHPDAEIEAFYSDHISDLPLAKLAKRAWLVKGNRPEDIVSWETDSAR